MASSRSSWLAREAIPLRRLGTPMCPQGPSAQSAALLTIARQRRRSLWPNWLLLRFQQASRHAVQADLPRHRAWAMAITTTLALALVLHGMYSAIRRRL